MRYLSNREEFLKRSINKIEEHKEYEEYNKIFEEAPFANDIPWGDSLIGRLINRVIRNAKKGANLVRIKSVIKKLQDAMDDILDGRVESQLDEENKKDLERLKAFSFIDSLEKAVNDEEDIKTIINLTESAIKEIEKFELDNKENLIKQLQDFLEFLKTLEKESGKGEGEEGEGSEGKEGEGSGEKSASALYPIMVKNLKALGIILDAYKRVKLQPTASVKSQESPKYKTKAGDTVDKIVANTSVNVKKLTADTLRQKNKKILDLYPKNNQTLKPGLELIMEGTLGPGGSPDRGNIKSGEDHLTQAFTKLKKDIEVLISAKEKGIGVDTNFINAITSKAVDSNTKELIKSLYVEINKYLVGDKKATIQDKDPLYKESIEIISDKNKKIVVAEKIARFTKRALQFDKQGLYGGLGDLGKPLQDFVDTIKQIMQMQPSEPKKEEPKKEATKESFLFRYDSFLKLVKEAEEGIEKSEEKKEGEEDSEVGDPVEMTTAQKIKDYWSKKIDVKAFTMERAEVDKTRQNFEKIEKDANKEKFWIYGIDPIIEIVKCFNRAYKLHTTPVIPNVGTSTGRVSASTFAQYTCFGGGDRLEAGIKGGPYRNNAIFNQWENAVLDITKQTKYEKIFRGDTVLKTADGKEIKDAGRNLRKFMTDMLTGEEFYKTSGRSSGEDGNLQAKFLDKYFGWSGESKALEVQPGDNKTNSQTSEKIKTEEVTFTDKTIKFEDFDELKGSIFAVACTTDKGVQRLYFLIQDITSESTYVSYSRTFGFFNNYLQKSGVLFTSGLKGGKLGATPNLSFTTRENKNIQLKACKIPTNKLISKDGKFLPTGNHKIKYLFREENLVGKPVQLSADEETLNMTTFYTFVNQTKDESGTETLERVKVKGDLNTHITSVGKGFPNLKTTNDIQKTTFS